MLNTLARNQWRGISLVNMCKARNFCTSQAAAQKFFSSRDHKASLTQHGTLPVGFSTSSVDVDFSPEEVPHLKCQLRQTVGQRPYFCSRVHHYVARLVAESYWNLYEYCTNHSDLRALKRWSSPLLIFSVDCLGWAYTQLRWGLHKEHFSWSTSQDWSKATRRGDHPGSFDQ